MGCGMSSMLNPEDAADAPPRQISQPITRVNINPPSIDSFNSKQEGGPEADNEGREEEEDKEHTYHSQILFLHPSPSFKDYCINSSDSADLSFRLSNHFNDTDDSVRHDDEDSAKRDNDNDYNKPLEIKERKKGRRRGFRNIVLHMGKSRGKKNRLNFDYYNTHPSYDDATPNKVIGKAA